MFRNSTVTEPNSLNTRRVTFAASIGNVLESYDFNLYAGLAVFFGARFFPRQDAAAALLSSLAVFGAGYILRPVGAIVLGPLGDRLGRKRIFLLATVIMGFATVGIGLLPTYTSVGIIAPILLVTLRLLQGFALGGEVGGAATYVVEHAPRRQRGFYTGWLSMGASGGFLMSLAVLVIIRLSISEAAFTSWGWRLPFIGSVILFAIAFYVRQSLEETPAFTDLKRKGDISKSPLRDSFTHTSTLGYVLLALALASATTVAFFTTVVYSNVYMQSVLHIPLTNAAVITGAAIVISMPFYPFSGWLSDRVGRKWVILGGLLFTAIFVVPLFIALRNVASAKESNYLLTILIVGGMMVGTAFAFGPVLALITELFPARIRFTSFSLPYQVGAGWVGGFTPYIITVLVAYTGASTGGLWFVVGVLVVGALVLSFGLKTKAVDKDSVSVANPRHPT